MTAPVRCLLLLLLCTASDIPPDEARRYRRILRPGTDPARRLAVLPDVAFHDGKEATELLLDVLADTIRHAGELERKRADNDAEIQGVLEPQFRKAAASDGAVNYAGLERQQKLQRDLGDRITREEQVIRALRGTLASLRDRESLRRLRRQAGDRKPPRLRLLVIDALGDIDDPELTEELVELLSDSDLEVRLAAAAALARHDPERVPTQAFGGLLGAREWRARAVAIDALARLGGPTALELLIRRTPHEEGRQLGVLVDHLETMTGQPLGRSPQAWLDWWQAHGAAFEPERVVLADRVREATDASGRYFGIAIDSLRVVFVIDISGTMQAAVEDHEDYDPGPGNSRLDLARREVKAAISALPSDAKFNLVAYSDVVLPWKDLLQPATPRVKREAFAFLDGLVALGQTNIHDALETAFRLSPWTVKDRFYDRTADTILFLSDGGPTAGRTVDCDEILQQVREWNRTRKITIHTIGIGRQTNRPFLKSLAQQNDGTWRFVE